MSCAGLLYAQNPVAILPGSPVSSVLSTVLPGLLPSLLQSLTSTKPERPFITSDTSQAVSSEAPEPIPGGCFLTPGLSCPSMAPPHHSSQSFQLLFVCFSMANATSLRIPRNIALCVEKKQAPTPPPCSRKVAAEMTQYLSRWLVFFNLIQTQSSANI